MKKMRKKMSKKASKKLFRNTVDYTKKINVTPPLMRGGIRL